MNWLSAILATIVAVLLLVTIKRVEASREAEREMVEARAALQRCEATARQLPPAPTPTLIPAPAPALEGGGRRTTALDARPNGVDPERKDARGREAAKRECERVAERLGKSATLWCAGL